MLTTAYSVTDANRSHRAFAQAVLLIDGIEQTTPLQVIGGSVSVDASAAIRRRAKLTLVGYHPEVDPFTCEVRLSRSVNDEMVDLGVFRIEDPTFSESNGGITTQLDCYDRAYWVSSLRLTQPYSVVANGTLNLVHTAISDLLLSRAPGLIMDVTPSTYAIPATTFEEGSDPWEKAIKMAESAGMELFFDTTGICRLHYVPVDTANVVATYGTEARILSAGKKQSTKGTFSRAIVTGENTANSVPIRSEKVDDNPLSPSYYLGAFGDRPTWLRSQFITTQSQADSSAAALLARKSGRAETVSIEGIPNPAHDAGDMIRIVHSNLDMDVTVALDTIEIPLEAEGSMKLGTRERRVAF